MGKILSNIWEVKLKEGVDPLVNFSKDRTWYCFRYEHGYFGQCIFLFNFRSIGETYSTLDINEMSERFDLINRWDPNNSNFENFFDRYFNEYGVEGNLNRNVIKKYFKI